MGIFGSPPLPHPRGNTSELAFLFILQFVFFLVMCILWLIVTIIQVVVALIAWLIWYIIRKEVESECKQIGDACVCDSDKSLPFTGEKKNSTLSYHFSVPRRCFVEFNIIFLTCFRGTPSKSLGRSVPLED